MSISTVVIREVWCDEPGCYDSVRVDDDGQGGLTHVQARLVARGEGWGRSKGRDFCRAHRPDLLVNSLFPVDTHDTQPTDPGCGCSTNPARARYADGDPAGCYCTCSDDAREGCEHEPDEPQSSGQERAQ